jgi:hypothetical protein
MIDVRCRGTVLLTIADGKGRWIVAPPFFFARYVRLGWTTQSSTSRCIFPILASHHHIGQRIEPLCTLLTRLTFGRFGSAAALMMPSILPVQSQLSQSSAPTIV